jgi:hypothetical protein
MAWPTNASAAGRRYTAPYRSRIAIGL